MEVALYRTKFDECSRAYGASTDLSMPRGVDNDTQLCAGAGQLRKDACNVRPPLFNILFKCFRIPHSTREVVSQSHTCAEISV